MAKHWTKWTFEMNAFLKNNYEWYGDSYLAELFQKHFPKHYKWTNKHIEKRRSYLNLKRTKEQVRCLRIINNKDDRQFRMWDTRGRIQEGEVREWQGRKYIKVQGGVISLNRHIAQAKAGQIVRAFEGGLKIITPADNARLNNKRRAALPQELKQTIRTLNQLKKIIHG